MVKVIADKKTDRILGAHIIGPVPQTDPGSWRDDC